MESQSRSITQDKSEEFAIRIIELYKYLTTEKNEYIISKQLFRSGTSIGANIAEAEVAVSKADFIAKMYISFKECAESRFWLRLLHRAKYLTDEQFNSLMNDCMELLRLLSSITKTARENNS